MNRDPARSAPAARHLTHRQAARVYDRIGRVQDLQALYEHRATADLIAHADFEHARAVFELGYGTGALAARLLERHLPAASTYRGVDVSPRMHELASRRLGPYAGRAEARLSDGSFRFPFDDGSFDRFVATYVLDLLSPGDIDRVLAEAGRLLDPGAGLLCLVSLTFGDTGPARVVTGVWQALWSLRPGLVGGCRPLRLVGRLDPGSWAVRHRSVVTAFGISSEVVVAARGSQTPRRA